MSLALVTGAGISLTQFEPREPIDPVTTPSPSPSATPLELGAHGLCGHDRYSTDDDGSELFATETTDLWVTLRLENPVRTRSARSGGELDVAVELSNRGNPAGDPVLVASTEGPVLLVVDFHGDIVGYARLAAPISPVQLNPTESISYSGFGPIVACPGARAENGFTPVGQYDGVIVQDFDQDDDTPFDVAVSFGDLWVTPADGSPAPRLGECGSSLARMNTATGTLTFESQNVLAHSGEPFDPRARLANAGLQDAEEPLRGGAVLLVIDSDYQVISRAEPLDAVAVSALPGDETLELGTFAPLTDCVTGGDLEPGVYQYQLARIIAEPGATNAVDLLSMSAWIAVTDDPAATYTPVELPTLPVCGERVDEFAFDPALPAGTVTYAGYSSWDPELGPVDDAVDGHPTVEFETTYTGPPRDLTFLTRASVLVRDGVVVAAEEMGGWGGAQPERWTTGSIQSSLLGGGSDCAAEEDYTEYEPEGRYTIIGFTVYDYTDEHGLPNVEVATLGPVQVDFGSRP